MLYNIIEIIILSLIQGISEFLPISSSAHLVVVSTLYEFKSSSLLIDVSLHLGSLLAIIFFFRNELLDLRNNQKLLLLMIFGSIPLIFRIPVEQNRANLFLKRYKNNCMDDFDIRNYLWSLQINVNLIKRYHPI